MVLEHGGRFVDVEDAGSAVEFLMCLGMEPGDAEGLVKACRKDLQERVDEQGDVKDRYERLTDGIASELNDMLDEIENLRGPSRKGNTRADIAGRLSDIRDNIEDLNGALGII